MIGLVRMKIVRVIFSPEAEEVYNYLNANLSSKTERTIFNSVNKKVELIKINPHYGDPISKNCLCNYSEGISN